jgi:hypothetical protein
MKKAHQICLSLTLLLFPLFAISQQNKPTKHALLFAISDYPESSGWDKLSSTNDIIHLSKALKFIGFAPDHIESIVDSKVTIPGITEAFANLNARIKKGDIVLIHFSGHGRQVEVDTDNKIDGYDECFVPYNVVSDEKINPNDSVQLRTEMAKYLRGHMLGDLLKQTRAKLGSTGDLIVTLDFCYSGSASRGANKVRGGKVPLLSKNFNPAKHQLSDSSQLFRQTLIEPQDQDLAPYNVISATRPEELDSETTDENGKGIGPLSYALFQSFKQLNPNITYLSFFARIQSMMNISAQNQHPVLEGNATTRTLFGGKFLQQSTFFEIDEIIAKNKITVKAGTIAGFGIGAKIMLHTAGTNDPTAKKPISLGTVVSSDNYTATVQLDNPINLKQTYDGWIFLKEPFYKVDPVALQIVSTQTSNNQNSFTTIEAQKIEASLQSFPSVNLHANPELLLVKGVEKDSLIVASNGYLFSELTSALNNIEELKTKLKQYIQHQFLLGVEAKTEGISMEVKLVPVINNIADTSLLAGKMVNGIYEFSEGDEVTLSIRNTGKRLSYVSVIDLQPDGIINAILPSNKEGTNLPDSLRFKANNSTYVFDPNSFKIRISKPFGTEVFKVFVSEKKINLNDIANSKGESSGRNNLSMLEFILKDSYQGAHNRGSEPADGTISEIIFRIKPK